MPSLTLLGQSVVSGILAGGLYGLLALGLSLSWGLLRLVNLGHFALAFLGAYLTYQLGTAFGTCPPGLALLLIVPLFFALGVGPARGLRALRRHRVHLAAGHVRGDRHYRVPIQWFWTADFRRYETAYGTASTPHRPALRSHPELLAAHRGRAGPRHLGVAALHLCGQGAAGQRGGRADRRGLRGEPPAPGPPPLRSRGGLAGVAGAFVALISTLAPAQICAWIGVVFAAVIIGGLVIPLGPLWPAW